MPGKVVVIGGGYAGVEAAKGLDKAFDVTLVAGGEVFRHVVGGLRASAAPEQAPRMMVPYDGVLKKGAVKKCKASKISAEESTVTLATGETLPYDYLVLAMGNLHPKTVGVANNAATTAEAASVYRQANVELKAATKILIVGGGPIGIEMAGEIMEEMPGQKSVTLVTSKELMESPTVAFPQKFRTRLRKKLEKVGVTVHTNAGRVKLGEDEVNAQGFIPGTKTYSWGDGQMEMEAELCIVCTHATETPSIYAESGLQAWLNERGEVKVEDTFEVKGAPAGKVFAVGDCTDLAVPKTAYLAGVEGASVAKQVVASAAGRPLKNAKPAVMPVSIVPLGKRGGVSSMPMGLVVGNFMTKSLKSKDLFVAKYWSDLGAGKPPAV